MPNPKWSVKAMEFAEDYIIHLTFEDGSRKAFDCSELLTEPVYWQLNDKRFFQQAAALYGTVRWNDEIDIAPEYLYEHGINIT